MSRRHKPRNRQRNRAAIDKARIPAGPMAGTTVDRATPLAELLHQATRARDYAPHPMDRDPRDLNQFGPGHALTPAPLDPGRPDTGRPEPRGSEYPISWNLRTGPDRAIPWQVLRDAADNVDIIRRCIQVRKKHVRGLKWGWTVSADAISAAYQADPRRGHDDIAAELREKYAPQITRLTAFWTNPWRGHVKGLGMWLNMLQEEVVVLDALPVYPRRTIGGDVHSLEIIDGTTIKPLLNHRGFTPQPPFPAYQQILYGFPRGEFMADPVVDAAGELLTDEHGNPQIQNPFGSDELFYWRENPRTFTPYGFSDVEMALISARLYLKRQGWMFAEYDDGAMGSAWLVPDGATEFDLREHRKWEDALNDEMAGNTKRRKRAKLAPPGFKPEVIPSEAERYKPEYDLHLIKLVASHLGVNIAELGFTEAKGLGSAGYHEGQEDVQDRVGRRPDTEMLTEIIMTLSAEFLDAPPELEFAFTGLESEDEAAADQVADARVRGGRIVLNEDRRRQGLPLYNFPEADMPMVITQRGVIFLEGASQLGVAGEIIGPPQGPNAPAMVDGAGQEAPDGTEDDGQEDEPGDGPDKPADGRTGAPARPTTGSQGKPATATKTTSIVPPPQWRIPDLNADQIAEVAAFRRWLKKRAGDPGGKPFEFATLTAAQALSTGLIQAGETHVVATFKASAPKASARHWPGWDRDQETAAHWSAELRKALTSGVDVGGLAADWLLERGQMAKAAGDDPDGTDDADGWLNGRGLPLTIAAILAVILYQAWTEGWFIGDRSARAVAFGIDMDWSGWKPGDPEAARLILGADGTGAGLAQLLDAGGITIGSISAGRTDELAKALAAALANGDSPDTLARKLRTVLDDPSWADMVAVTEINRAVSAATLEVYAANGLDGKSWLTAADDRVCPTICEPNGIDGPIPLGAVFSSGVQAPPGHPRCRCALAGETLTPAEAAAADTADLNPGATE